MNPIRIACLLVASSWTAPAPAAERWVSPSGESSATGSADAPWDLQSALSGQHPVDPGSVIWLRGGVYRCSDRSPNGAFLLTRHRGTAERPIVFRSAPGERVTIDGGLVIGSNRDGEDPAHVWVRDLEITVSEPGRRTEQTGSWPTDLGAPFGGVTMQGSDGCKLINLVVHGNAGGGVSLWTPARNAELYGCVIAGNGWSAPDRGHGHGIYAQNQKGWKTIRHCILTVPDDRGDQLAQFYGSGRSHLENFRVEENIGYGAGRHTRFLLGGGAVSRNHHVLGNAIHFASLQLGYSAKGNTGGRAIGNIVSRGGLNFHFYDQCEVKGNLVVGDSIRQVECGPGVVLQENTILRTEREFPGEPRILWFRNEHDPDRAHLAVFNWPRLDRVPVGVDGFLRPGDRYRMLDPANMFGVPVSAGVCEGESIDLPMDGEFAAFVVLRDP